MGLAVFAQQSVSNGAGGAKAGRRRRALRLQLDHSHGNGLMRVSYSCGVATRGESGQTYTNLWAYSRALEVRYCRDDLHAGTGVRYALLGNGRGFGSRFHAHRMVLSILRNVYRLAWRGPYGQRHFFERALRRIAENHGPTAEPQADFDVRDEK